ncbi:MAG TPA: sigma-70 family RNA polymerase sigma factor [Roseiarcus sp.]|nr:sigma-70 family RNA polymerase sigma factor [Roseiarcus sp.]
MDPSSGSSSAGEDLAALMTRVASRDRAAFAALYRATQAKLFGVVVRIVSRRDVAGEVLQEAYVRIWEKAADFDLTKGSPLAWMTAIARNRALDEMRRPKPLAIGDLSEGFDPPAEETDPLASRDRSERLAALLRCLDALDPEKRKIVLLAYYRGASREALAKKFDHPVPTIKTWLRRSLSELKDCLSS